MKIIDNYNKAKIFYERKMVLDAKDISTLSNQAITSYHILESSALPKNVQNMINMQKAKKSVFLEDGVIDKKSMMINYVENRKASNMMTSTIKEFNKEVAEEEKELEKKDKNYFRNSIIANTPIYEESESSGSSEDDSLPVDPAKKSKSVNHPFLPLHENILINYKKTTSNKYIKKKILI